MSKNYEIYHSYPAREVPQLNLRILISEFIIDAALDMGQKPDDGIYDRVTYFVGRDFCDLEIIQIASAFKRGALGQFGPGKLVPRTIYNWLVTAKGENSFKTDAVSKIDTTPGFSELHKFPLGKAINKKIDWYRKGLITIDPEGRPDEWDKINLKTLSEMIGKGMMPTPNDFGIEPK